MTGPTRYALLRDRRAWVDCSFHQLRVGEAGDIELMVGDADGVGATHGTLVTDALDAGLESSWLRVAVEADVPASTRMRVEVAAANAPAVSPSYVPAPGPDFWLPSVLALNSASDDSDPARFRYLWVRIHLESLDATRSPRLRQVRAQTAGEDFLGDLPAVFAREDVGQGHYLERLLELLGSKFGDWERGRQHLARRLDPYWAPAGDLPWLAEWLGWDRLPALPPDELRALVLRLAELNQMRGTLAGLRAIVAAFTGIEVQIVEQFHRRPMWVLGDAELGIDTGMSALADGMVTPGESVMVVGETIVGRQGPLDREHFGAPVFDEDAHRFTVFVPPGAACTDAARARLRRIIDEEKPAHTDYHLCFLERMQLGRNMTVGVDAYVGQAYEPQPLGKARLGQGTYVADPPGRIRIGETDPIRDGARLE